MMELNDMPKEGSNCMQLHQQLSALYRPYSRTVRIKLQMSELQSLRIYICCYFCSIVQTKYFPRGDIVKNLKMSLLDGPLTNCTLVLCTY